MTETVTQIRLEALNRAGALKPALLAEDVGGGTVRCNICQRRCRVPKGGVGYCRTKLNHEGVLYCSIYGVISSAAADPIEKKPVFHYKPGSLCFSVGSLGCNFRCVFCQNWEIAYADAVEGGSRLCATGVTPERLAEMALANSCEGVAWTYNEPGIWLNYTLDCAKLCKNKGLYTVYVTNGYATAEHLEAVAPYLDVYRVDIKSLDDRFYKELIGVPSVQGVLANAVLARHKWHIHVECVTNVIPGWNDSEDDIAAIARWIASHLGDDTPWHVTRFFPYGQLSHLSPTPVETLEGAVRIGRREGLKFVYLGNVASETGENTYCPECGSLAVQRSHYTTSIRNLDDSGRCSVDGADLNIHI